MWELFVQANDKFLKKCLRREINPRVKVLLLSARTCFLIVIVPQIARYCRKRICPVRAKYTFMCRNSQKSHKNNTFSCHNLSDFFACTSTSLEHITTWVLYTSPINATGEISDVFVSFRTVLLAFFWEGMFFGFEIIKFFRHATSSFLWTWEHSLSGLNTCLCA